VEEVRAQGVERRARALRGELVELSGPRVDVETGMRVRRDAQRRDVETDLVFGGVDCGDEPLASKLSCALPGSLGGVHRQRNYLLPSSYTFALMVAHSDTTSLHETVARLLHANAQRLTPTRLQIVDVLAAAGPVTIPEILAAQRGLAQSSVYRNLVVLED